ncbi:MAG: hypothetical protein ACUVRS_06655 [Armatimonadota bacterium]
MRRGGAIWVILAVLVVFLTAGVVLAATQQPKTRPVVYEQFGFTVYVPHTAVRETLSADKPEVLCDTFRYGDLVYLVKVTEVPSDTLTVTAVEKKLQVLTSSGGSLVGARRWELEIGETLFKGLSGRFTLDMSLPEAAVIKRALGAKGAHCCFAMAPLGDRFSPIVELGVVGPASRSSEIEDLARFFVYKFSRGAAGVSIAAAEDRGKRSSSKPTSNPDSLKKGDIELVGRVEHVDRSAKSFILIVERIRMPQTGYIMLDPPRRKVVYFREPLPEQVKEGATVRVVGFNTGVGKPMTADVIKSGRY